MSCTWRVETPHHPVYVKLVSSAHRPHIVRGRWEAQLKQSFGPSVALRTHQLTQRMIGHGLYVPEVLIAAQRRRGWHCDDLLATKAVTGSPLTDALAINNGSGQQVIDDTFSMVGQRIAQLHEKGFVHGHLVPGHVFVTPDRTNAWFLDNDETRWRSAGIGESDRRYNLTQLVSRLGTDHYPHVSGAVRSLIESYLDTIGVMGRPRRRWHYRILRCARQRSQKRRRRRLADLSSTSPPLAATCEAAKQMA